MPGSAVLFSFALPGLDCVLRTPLEEHSAAALVERVRRRSLEVLPNDHELAAVVEVDDVTGEHSGVDDVEDPANRCTLVVAPGAAVDRQADLLRPHREGAPAAGQDVRRPDEACDERVVGPLVDGLRRTDLLDPALV